MVSVNHEVIRSLMCDKYNKKVLNIKQLDGYVDLNYKLEIVDGNSDRTSGYETVILKLISDSIETINLQHKIMVYLNDKGVDTCRPVHTVEGKSTCKVGVRTDQCKDSVSEELACVLTYIPGITVRCAGHPAGLMEEFGRFAGRVDKLLLHFEQDNLQYTDTIWELSQTSKLEALIEKYCTKDVKELGMNIISGFRKDILPVLASFQKGYIHGDLNDCNFIVTQTTTDADKYTISGLIDYGDVCVSFYIYEIAALMADMMSVCRKKQHPLEVGKLILMGFMQEFELNSVELKCLRLVICVRMVQFYVFGAEIIENDPSNEYAKLDRDDYLEMCKYLWEIGDERFKHEVLDEKMVK
ncbi:hydroxylysine kinase-like [Mercenaria mercenaria]|uniref:hydroxylysine kinase-like n=1 Tax=Mercenaria mercenaria TaxID=6596 RepID=UPI00234ED95C|nr:hydroxylysine kinase-like [Mercenaria mercenaria]